MRLPQRTGFPDEGADLRRTHALHRMADATGELDPVRRRNGRPSQDSDKRETWILHKDDR